MGKRLQRDQRGMSSLLVTMLMMVITSLIVLAFAQIARREQRTALDNQLSSQAFYAAESGINDAKRVIQAGDDLAQYDECSNDLTNSPDADLSSAHDGSVRYSCVLIDAKPKTLLGHGDTETPAVFHIKSSVTAGNYWPGGLTISWDKPEGASGSAAGCPSNASADLFTDASAASWNCPFSVLRYELTRITTPITTQGLASNTQTAFVIPRGSGSVVNFTPGEAVSATPGHGNRFMATSCTASRCSVTINGATLTSREYYLNVRYMYGTESGLTISRGGDAYFEDSQVHVDVTGKAQDVLRRIRVALNTSGGESGIGTAFMASDGPCKLSFIGAEGNGTPTYSDSCSDGSNIINAVGP